MKRELFKSGQHLSQGIRPRYAGTVSTGQLNRINPESFTGSPAAPLRLDSPVIEA